MLIWQFFSGTVMPIRQDLTVRFVEQPASANLNSNTGNYTISNLMGNVNIWRPSFFVSILGNSIPVILWGSICCGVFLLRRILGNVYHGKHFAKENVRNMRIIGWMIIIIPHVLGLMRNVVINTIPFGTFINGHLINRFSGGIVQMFSFAFYQEAIFAGLIVFVFAEVFKEGVKIKEENDLTV